MATVGIIPSFLECLCSENSETLARTVVSTHLQFPSKTKGNLEIFPELWSALSNWMGSREV